MSTPTTPATNKPQTKLDRLRAIGTPSPAVNLDMARQFIHAITGSSATPMAWSAIQERQGVVERTPSLFLYGPLHEHEAALIEANERGCSIECIINETNGTGTTASDIKAVRALWITTDREQARFTREMVDAIRPQPDLITEISPAVFNLFWTMAPGDCSISDFYPVLLHMSRQLKSSQKVLHIEQRFRVPGFCSWPDALKLFPVEIISDRSRGLS